MNGSASPWPLFFSADEKVRALTVALEREMATAAPACCPGYGYRGEPASGNGVAYSYEKMNWGCGMGPHLLSSKAV